MDSSGKAFAEHWIWAADKGLLNLNTAKAVRAACAQVLSVLDGWETVDVRNLDLNDLFLRFQNKRGKDFIPESLETYMRRFTVAHRAFLDYIADPTTWKPPFRDRSSSKIERLKAPALPPEPRQTTVSSAAPPPPQKQSGSDFVDYPFPLRDGRIVRLQLPIDLKAADVTRLTAFLNSLVIDAESGEA
jgi:hypothetical protein